MNTFLYTTGALIIYKASDLVIGIFLGTTEVGHFALAMANTFLYTTGALIIYKASDLVIGIFLGTTEVGHFALAMAGILLLSQFLQAFTAAIKPAVSDLDARDDQARVRQIAFLAQKYSLLWTPGTIRPACVRSRFWPRNTACCSSSRPAASF